MADSTSSSTTFQVCYGVPLRATPATRDDEKTIWSDLEVYRSKKCSEILVATEFPPSVSPTPVNGFVETVLKCHDYNHNLVIRPDDIWMAILTQFSFYINRNAEMFRKVVRLYERKELSISVDGSLRLANSDAFLLKISKKFDEHYVDKEVKDWILPDFTTTTPRDIISCGIACISTTTKCLKEKYALTGGIPNITLEGTVSDWECIVSRIEKLKEYDLDEWYDMLKPILNEFAAARANKSNPKFWNGICSRLEIGGKSFISGWMTAFAVFNEDGVWAEECKPWPVINTIPSGIVSVDLKLADGGGVYDCLIIAGHVGYEIEEDNCTLRPQIGWGLGLKSVRRNSLQKFFSVV